MNNLTNNIKPIREIWIKWATRYPKCFMVSRDMRGYVLYPSNKVHVVSDRFPVWRRDSSGYRITPDTYIKLRLHYGVIETNI